METESLPVAPPESIVQAPIKKSGSLKFLIVVVLAVIILSTVIGVTVGYFLASSKKESTETTVSIPIVSSPIPTPTPNPTANWKTYTNTKYKYEFKYPMDWLEIPQNLLAGAVIDKVQINTKKDNDIPNIKITVWKEGVITKGGSVYKMNGLIGERSISEVPSGIFHDIVTLTKSSGDYTIELEYSLNNKETYSRIFDQILSTFKFLD